MFCRFLVLLFCVVINSLKFHASYSQSGYDDFVSLNQNFSEIKDFLRSVSGIVQKIAILTACLFNTTIDVFYTNNKEFASISLWYYTNRLVV